MNNRERGSDHAVRFVRWAARVLGLGLLVLAALFAADVGGPDPFRWGGGESACALWFLTMLFGLALAWRWEGIGSALVLVGFAFFCGADIVSSQRHSVGWALVLFPIVALLQLFCWYRSRLLENHH